MLKLSENSAGALGVHFQAVIAPCISGRMLGLLKRKTPLEPGDPSPMITAHLESHNHSRLGVCFFFLNSGDKDTFPPQLPYWGVAKVLVFLNE